MEGVAGFEEGGVEEDLVGLVEGEGQLVRGHGFAVFLAAAGAHIGGLWMIIDSSERERM